jgi:excisionase family DNA binding protein
MNFTLGEAARQCGVAKGTISKAIKTGKLSATRREDGSELYAHSPLSTSNLRAVPSSLLQ